MVTFAAAVDGEDVDDFLDQQPHQGDDDEFLQQWPGQWEEEEEEEYDDDFMSDDDDDYWSTQGDDDDSSTMSDGVDDEEEYPFPVHAPPAAASEAAIAALEAAEAPADDCCPVCLQDYGGEAPPETSLARPWSRVASCGHRFHAACVEKWLRLKLTCPVCRCSAAAVPPAHLAARRRDDAAPEPPRPLPDIVEEFLAMGYEECLVFEKSPRWVEFINDPYRHITWSSSRAS